MAGGGTGMPYVFRCAKCRVCRPTCSPARGRNVVATGKRRPNNGHVGYRSMKVFVQYRCLVCDHVGWTKHTDAENFPMELV